MLRPRCTYKNTSTEIIGKLNKEINAALTDPKTRARLADLGGTLLAGSPTNFGKLIADETEKWAKVISGRHQGAVRLGGRFGSSAPFRRIMPSSA